VGVARSGHCDLDSGENPPLVGSQEWLVDSSGRGSFSGVDAKELVEDEGAFVRMDRGGKMLKIWSSSRGGP